MVGRTLALIRARLAMAHRSGWAVPSILFHALLGALFAALVDTLPPFGYAFFALSIATLFLALPLLSDLGALLRLDEAAEWARALPARPLEQRLARLFHLGLMVAALDLALVVPFALRAPVGVGRLELVLAGLGLAAVLSAVLIWIQSLLWPRWENALIVLQTVVLGAVVIGSVQVLGHLPELARLTPELAWLQPLPSAWFAAAAVEPGSGPGPALATAAAIGLLALVPARPARWGTSGRGLVERLLDPLRRLAGRRWVRGEEHGAFDLVFLGLPREREFRLRTLPVLGIPMAFLWIGLRGDPASSNDLLAILLFTVGVYLPVLLAHVPLTESPGAAWLLYTAPRTASEVAAGATKALFLRYVLPLHVVLAGVGLSMGAADLLVRLWPASTLCSLLALQVLYPRCVHHLPLSVGPDQLGGGLDWLSRVVGLALGMTVLAVAANRMAGMALGWLLAAAAWGASVLLFRRARTSRP
jgi:hypothetical protein